MTRGFERRTTDKTEPERPQVSCAHDLCRDGAIVRIKTATGWANLCRRHYEAHFLAEARESTAHLSTVETRQKLKKFAALHIRRPNKDWARKIVEQAKTGNVPEVSLRFALKALGQPAFERREADREMVDF